jgi:trigger factor
VPLRIVEQKYGSKVREEAISEVISTSFQEAIEQEKLELAGQPAIDYDRNAISPDGGLSYTAIFPIIAEAPVINVEGLAVEKPVSEVTETDISLMLERLRLQYQKWQYVETPATEGSRVTVDLVGTINGRAFKGNEINKLSVVLGEKNSILPGLSENLVAVSTGENREFDITFPADYSNIVLAGNVVHFSAHVRGVAISVLPEVDAEFAKKLGISDGNLDILQKDIRENMERELKQAIKMKIKENVFAALAAANPIDVLDSAIEQEANLLLRNRQMELFAQGKYEVKLTPDMFKETAKNRVRVGLLINELARVNAIQVQPERVRQLIEEAASSYEEPETVINSYYSNPEMLRTVEINALEDQIVEWLLTKFTVTDKKMGFYELADRIEDNQFRAIA